MHCEASPTPDPSDINGCWVSQTSPTGDPFFIGNNTLIVDGKAVTTLTRVANNRYATLVKGRIAREVAEVMYGTIHWGNQDVWIPAPFGACATTTPTAATTTAATTTATATAPERGDGSPEGGFGSTGCRLCWGDTGSGWKHASPSTNANVQVAVVVGGGLIENSCRELCLYELVGFVNET